MIKALTAEVQERCWCTYQDRPYCHTCHGTGTRTHREGMFLCIGGPFHGEFLNRSAVTDEYTDFNAARGTRHGRRWTGTRWIHKGESMIWVHNSLLP